MDRADPFDEEPNLTTRHALRRRSPDHPLISIFDAKRLNDLLRRDALEALARCTTGRGSLVDAEQKIRQWQSSIDTLVEALKANEKVVESLAARAKTKPMVTKGYETE